MARSDAERSLNPAADKQRMYIALAVLVVLGLASWFTIDTSAVLQVRGFRAIPVRWIPIAVLGLFGFRIVLANMRARLEAKGSKEG
jgi:hypothetical protein